jgi:hypothetical protein
MIVDLSADRFQAPQLFVFTWRFFKQEKNILFFRQDFPQAESKSFCHGFHEFHRTNLDFVKFVKLWRVYRCGQRPLRVLAVDPVRTEIPVLRASLPRCIISALN